MGVLNTKGLEKLGITNKTKAIEGGTIGRFNDTNPNGFLAENAFVPKLENVINLSVEKIVENILLAEKEYLKNGITTIQDGLTKKKEWDILKYIAEKKLFTADIVSYIDIKEKNILNQNSEYVKKYNNNLKIGGYKIILDGSPQGKTAWISKPYQNEKEYRGYGTYEDLEVEKYIHEANEDNMQILAHCNGDEASEQFIRIIEKENNDSRLRPVMIHAQLVRKDQLLRMKKDNILPSFFVTHIYYWGDIHVDNLGESAYNISPVKTACDLGINYTFHQYTPVIYPNLLETVEVAVNRKTKSGKVLGKEERITVYEALKAITINSAYQYFEENEKGSIREGKKADFVVLSNNPLMLNNKEDIKKIEVLETIKNGKTVYKK